MNFQDLFASTGGDAPRSLPRPNVVSPQEGFTGPWSSSSIGGLLQNPVYAGVPPFPPMMSDEQWVGVNVKMLRELGPEQYLVNLLYVLRETYAAVGDDDDDDDGPDIDFTIGKTPS